MIGARGMKIVQRAWESARANDCVVEDYDAFASRFALWLLERLALLQKGLGCPDLVPGLLETLRIRTYLETPDRVCTTQIAESWIRQAEVLGLCCLRVRVGQKTELDVLLQQGDCALFPVLGIALASASLESRRAAVLDLIQRIVLPDALPGAGPASFPAASSSGSPSNTATPDSLLPNAPAQNDAPSSDATPELGGRMPYDEARLEIAVREALPVTQDSPASMAQTASPVLVPAMSSAPDTLPGGANDIPFPDQPVISRQVDEAVNATAPFARDWFGLRAPTAAEREPVRRRMRSVLRCRQEDFEVLYRRIKRQGGLPSIEEFFLMVCVHCEIARRHPGMAYSVASGPMPVRQGIFCYYLDLPGLTTLTVVAKPSRCHSLAQLAVLLSPDMRQLSGAVWSLNRK